MVAHKRQAILQAAETLFATQGFNQTKIAEIAKESQIHEASIYAYFKNKKNILFDLYGQKVKSAVHGIKEHFQGMKEPGPKLRKLIWSYLADFQNNPHSGWIMMMAQRESHDFYASKQHRYVKEYSDIVSNLVVAGQKDGLFRKDLSPRSIRNMIIGTAVFTAIHATVNKRPYDPDEMSDVIYRLILNAAGDFSPSTSDKKERRQRSERVDNRKTQIVEAATHVFSKKGFSNATISDIAKQARLGDATLYEYFINKDDILMGIAGTYLQIFSCEAFWLAATPKAEQFLRKMIWKVIWQLYFNEDFSRVLILDLFRNADFYSSAQYKDFEDLQKKIMEWVENGQQEGAFIKDFPSITYFHMIIGTLDQFLIEQFLRNSAPLGLVELNAIVESLVLAIKVRETT